MSRQPPSFDLVVATVGRVDELRRLLASLREQEYEPLRVIVADQNGDDRLAGVLGDSELEVLQLGSEAGLSRARNVALEHVTADVVAFPDDDCVYPPGLLARVADRFGAAPELDGVTGRAEDSSGRSAPSWRSDPAVLSDDNVWNRAISYTMFLRRRVVEQVGDFDVRLGLGSSESWCSGEEIDYLVRAVRAGARIEYDPDLVVRHDLRALDSRIGARDGASIGYLLRKHAYPGRVIARMLIRPVGGAAVSLARLDPERARFHVATLRGRIAGLRASAE